MPLLSYEGVAITAMAAAVPQARFDNLTAGPPFTAGDAAEIVEKTGIRYRRIAGPHTCASDLCHAAANRLFEDTGVERKSVDVLLFVSQTPDYRMPATAVLLQDRLGLGMNTAAFDINLGCSGFVYGLSLAYSYCMQAGVNRVLLLNGETRTKAYSMRDKATGLLFGDAGSATLVEKRASVGQSFFTANSDGARGEHIIIRSGGYRYPSTMESLREQTFEDGSIRSGEHAAMKGRGVFEFLLLEVPKDIKAALTAAAVAVDEIDYFVFHQANRFMNEHIRKRLRLPADKVPYSLADYGNTSSVSIPLTMVADLASPLAAKANRLFICGFGVGLSWASGVVPCEPIHVSELVEVCDAATV